MGSVEDAARANAEAIEALPPGGIAVVPADAPELEPYLGRAPVEIRRFDPATVERAADGRWRFHVGGGRSSSSCPFRQRHLAENVLARADGLRRARAAARARSGGREPHRALALARRAARAARRRLRRQRRLQREPDLDAGGAARPRRAPPPGDAGASPCSARWRSSDGERPLPRARSALSSPSSGSTCSWPSATARPATSEPGVPEMRTVADADAAVAGPAEGSCTRVTPCSSRPRGPSGSKASPQRSRRSPPHGESAGRGPGGDGDRRRRSAHSSSRGCAGRASASRSARRARSTTSSSRGRRRWAGC